MKRSPWIKKALEAMKQLGRKYPEIKEFKKMPRIGDIGAHIFNAIIQTPYRFANEAPRRKRTGY